MTAAREQRLQGFGRASHSERSGFLLQVIRHHPNPGGTFCVTDTVRNTGSAAAAASTTRFNLSTTDLAEMRSAADWQPHSALLAASVTSSGTVTVR